MRKPLTGLMLGAALWCGCSSAPLPAQSPATILPLRTVRLYETGVGYFERTGAVTPSSGTSLPVPAAHLDDALKTLVVLGEGGRAMVDGLEFDSSVSEGMARALAGLPKEASSTITYLSLLSSLKGEAVEVQTHHDVYRGRVVDVVVPPEPPTAPSEGDDDGKKRAERHEEKKPELMLLLFTDDNQIRQFPSTEIASVRPVSSVAAARLGLALNALSTRAAQSRKLLRVMASSKGPVTLGYIAETPLWRTTYRVVLGAEGKQGVLQGWALLHNDTDEDWQEVRVQLVNGRPDSFLFPMAAPRYGRRELVTPDNELSTIPQLLEQTPDAIWGDHADMETTYGQGFGSGSGRLGGSHRSSAPSIRMGATSVGGGGGVSDLLQIGNLAGVQTATGMESAALFIYTLPRPLDLRAHGSALVPFVQSPVDVTSITWIDGDDNEPRMGVHFVNTTKQTLPSGPIAFFADGGFAGESTVDRLKPREERYMQFGADLDVEASRNTTASSEEPLKLTFEGGRLREHYIRRDTVIYTIENRGGQARRVHWTLPVVSNAKVEGPDKVDYDEQLAKPIAIFEVPARKKVERTVTMEQGLSRWTALDSVSVVVLKRLSEVESLPAEHRKVAADAADRRRKVDETHEAIAKTTQTIAEVEKDLERFREHLKALGGEKGAGVAANPFVKRILDAEDKLAALRTKLETLEKEQEGRRDEVYRVLMRLAPDTTKQ